MSHFFLPPLDTVTGETLGWATSLPNGELAAVASGVTVLAEATELVCDVTSGVVDEDDCPNVATGALSVFKELFGVGAVGTLLCGED